MIINSLTCVYNAIMLRIYGWQYWSLREEQPWTFDFNEAFCICVKLRNADKLPDVKFISVVPLNIIWSKYNRNICKLYIDILFEIYLFISSSTCMNSNRLFIMLAYRRNKAKQFWVCSSASFKRKRSINCQ